MVHVAGTAAVTIAAIFVHERPRNIFRTVRRFRVGGMLPSGVTFQFWHLGNCRQAVPFKTAEAKYVAVKFLIGPLFSLYPLFGVAPPGEGQYALPRNGHSQP